MAVGSGEAEMFLEEGAAGVWFGHRIDAIDVTTHGGSPRTVAGYS